MRAPIALFVYKRPWHTRQTVEALQRNPLAAESRLVVFSDAARSAEEVAAVQEVRAYIQTVDGFGSVELVERTENWGLAKSIIDGVTALCGEYGRVIVLEDDLVTSPYFLNYMNDALDRYVDEARVMHVSGYMFPIKSADLPQTFFYRPASCWGWGTWARAWKEFKKDTDWVYAAFDAERIRRFNLDGAYDFWAQVVGNSTGKLNTWAIFWYATVFLKDGLCLHPAQSYVNNIGLDGSGVHCSSTHEYTAVMADRPVTQWETRLEEDKQVLDRMQTFYRRNASPIGRIKRQLRRWTG